MNLILIIVLVVLIVALLGFWLLSCASVGTKKGSDGAVTITVVVGILVVVLSILIQLGVPERLFGTADTGVLLQTPMPGVGQAPAVSVTAPPNNNTNTQPGVGQPESHDIMNDGGVNNQNTPGAGQAAPGSGTGGNDGGAQTSPGSGATANGAPREADLNQD